VTTLRKTLKRLIRPLRLAAGRFVLQERNLVDKDGCIHAAASFISWNQIEGDYLEFGVWRGASFSVAFHAIERGRRIVAQAMPKTPEFQRWLSQRPRYFAFDSFEGLPEGDAARQTDYAAGAYACSEREFRANVAADDVDMSRVVTVPGMFDRSLNASAKARHALKRAALIFIDCDLYESTVPVLDFCTDLVGQGTIIVFQDWFRFQGRPDQGEQRACKEWLERNPQFELIEYWREGPQAVSFLVNMRAAPAA
jgi:hypothetical protein